MKKSWIFLCCTLVLWLAILPGTAYSKAKPYQDEVGSVHIAITSVIPWETYSKELQPKFTITPESALLEVMPTTSLHEMMLKQAFSANVGFALPFSTFSNQDVSSITSGTNTTSTEGGSSGSSQASSTVTGDNASSSVTDTSDNSSNSTNSTTDTSGSSTSSTSTKTKQSGDLSKLPTIPGAAAATGTPLSLPANTSLGLDPMLKYDAAAALYQNVKMRNLDLLCAAIPPGMKAYIVRMQVNLQPYRRNDSSYDAYVNCSFFFDRPSHLPSQYIQYSMRQSQALMDSIRQTKDSPPSEEPNPSEAEDALPDEQDGVLCPGFDWPSEQDDTEGVLGGSGQKKPNALNDFGTLHTERSEPHGSPIILPLLATDDFEGTIGAKSMDRALDLGMAISGMIQGTGAQAAAGMKNGQLDSVLGRGYNSLLTVARLNDNTFRIRIGAMQQYNKKFVMIPRNVTVSMLVMVPEDILSENGSISTFDELFTTYAPVKGKLYVGLGAQRATDGYDTWVSPYGEKMHPLSKDDTKSITRADKSVDTLFADKFGPAVPYDGNQEKIIDGTRYVVAQRESDCGLVNADYYIGKDATANECGSQNKSSGRQSGRIVRASDEEYEYLLMPGDQKALVDMGDSKYIELTGVHFVRIDKKYAKGDDKFIPTASDLPLLKDAVQVARGDGSYDEYVKVNGACLLEAVQSTEPSSLKVYVATDITLRNAKTGKELDRRVPADERYEKVAQLLGWEKIDDEAVAYLRDLETDAYNNDYDQFQKHYGQFQGHIIQSNGTLETPKDEIDRKSPGCSSPKVSPEIPVMSKQEVDPKSLSLWMELLALRIGKGHNNASFTLVKPDPAPKPSVRQGYCMALMDDGEKMTAAAGYCKNLDLAKISASMEVKQKGEAHYIAATDSGVDSHGSLVLTFPSLLKWKILDADSIRNGNDPVGNRTALETLWTDRCGTPAKDGPIVRVFTADQETPLATYTVGAYYPTLKPPPSITPADQTVFLQESGEELVGKVYGAKNMDQRQLSAEFSIELPLPKDDKSAKYRVEDKNIKKDENGNYFFIHRLVAKSTKLGDDGTITLVFDFPAQLRKIAVQQGSLGEDDMLVIHCGKDWRFGWVYPHSSK